ncbi:small integral membrane protein 15 isoform X1 [Pan troglodytes]|uniref:small integral membrane protein 15 isoform X1 n=1 Tax=Pan troglodytes TaxID=9598 RepID=UPI003013C309
MTLQLSGYSRGWGLSSDRPRGAKAKVPSCFGTAPRVLKPLHASSPTTWSPQDVAVSGSTLERSPPGCRHPPRAASPAAPRKSQRSAALPPPPPSRVLQLEVPRPTQQWRSRKLAPRLPHARLAARVACGRDAKAATSAFLLPVWR